MTPDGKYAPSLQPLRRLGKQWEKQGKRKPPKTKGTMMAILYATAHARAIISKYEALMSGKGVKNAKWANYYRRTAEAEFELEALNAYLLTLGDTP